MKSIWPLLLLAPAAALAAQEKPRTLVVQKPAAFQFASGAQDLPMTQAIAEELAKDGRTEPVRWSEDDKEFVEAASGLAVSPDPSDEQISELARRLQARYILIVEATQFEDKLYPRADLFQSGRRGAIWTTGPRRNSQNDSIVVKVDDRPNWPATARSVASLWVLQITTGPLKGLAQNAPLENQAAQPEPAPRRPRLELGASSGAEALAQAEDLVKRGQSGLAILYLKDAVDANPFEPERRIRLMELLSQQGMPLQAADEGRRAAVLTPGRPELWLASAKSWLLADRPEEAKSDVQEALARGADSALARRLLGDVAILQGDLAKARLEYSASLEKEEGLRARLGLGMVFALSRQPELAKGILEKVPTTGLEPADYAFVIELTEPTAKALGRQLGEFMPRARLGVAKPEVVADGERLERLAHALVEMLELVSPPPRSQSSHGARVLAHKLMRQASQEALSFARSGDSDAELEVVLSLGEALRQLAVANATYRAEQIDEGPET